MEITKDDVSRIHKKPYNLGKIREIMKEYTDDNYTELTLIDGSKRRFYHEYQVANLIKKILDAK